jgi:hypothetical protein
MERIMLLKPSHYCTSSEDIAIDPEYQLVLGRRTNSSLATPRLANNLYEVFKSIHKAVTSGQLVLILSGCYDLAHVGHLNYVEQCIQSFVEYKQCSREDLCVFILADDDAMISHVKHRKLQTEPIPRPVEPLEDRLNTLLVFPVDIVASLPFFKPETEEMKLISNVPVSFNEKAVEVFKKTKEELVSLIPDIKLDYSMSDLKSEFQGYFSMAVWHCKIFSWLVAMSEVNSGISRIVSIRDTNYLVPVSWVTRYSGIDLHLIEDEGVLSTTSLIKELLPFHGKDSWKFIREYKAKKIANI